MNQLYDLMQIVKNSGQRGQELMIDSFVIGYLFGKGKLKNKNEFQAFVEQLQEIKNQIDKGEQNPSFRDEFILSKLDCLQFLLKDEKKQQKKTSKKGPQQKNSLAQTTPINPQFDYKDQNELNQTQGEEVEKQQNQNKPQKQKTQLSQHQGVQTRQQQAQIKADQQKNEKQKNE